MAAIPQGLVGGPLESGASTFAFPPTFGRVARVLTHDFKGPFKARGLADTLAEPRWNELQKVKVT